MFEEPVENYHSKDSAIAPNGIPSWADESSDDEAISDAVYVHGSLLDYIDPHTSIVKKQEVSDKKPLEESKEPANANVSTATETLALVKDSVNPKITKEEEKEVVPDPDLTNQLIMMGFPAELVKKGLIKVKNESAAAAVDAIMELQEQTKKVEKKPEKKIKERILAYSCEICTFFNKEEKPICEICGSPAPQSAIVFEKSKEDEDKEKEEEALKLKKEQEEKERQEKEKLEKEE
jgi:hypothetical protein